MAEVIITYLYSFFDKLSRIDIAPALKLENSTFNFNHLYRSDFSAE